MNKKVKIEKWEKEAEKKKTFENLSDYVSKAETYGKKNIKNLNNIKKELIKLIAQCDYNSMLHLKKFLALNDIINELFNDVSICYKSYNDIVKGFEKQNEEIQKLKEEINKIKENKQ